MRTVTTELLHICGLYNWQVTAFENFWNYLKESEINSPISRPKYQSF